MNAIILAAGKSSRMQSDGYDTPKPLLPIMGVPNIERTVLMLHEFGIKDITILCNSECLNHYQFLQDRYHCKIIHSPIHHNTLYTMNQVIDKFYDTFVIEGDLVLARNVFSCEDRSFYYTMCYSESDEDEWCPVLEEQRISSIKIGRFSEPCIVGISFWSQKDCPTLQSILKKYFSEENFRDNTLFWDNCIATALDRLWIGTHEVSPNDVCEMNTGSEYEYAKEMCSRYYSSCQNFILDYSRETRIHPRRISFVSDLDACMQWQQYLLSYLNGKSDEKEEAKNPTVFTKGEYPFMVKDVQTGNFIAYFDIAEASDYILLRRLFVHETVRGQGIGTEIVNYIRLYSKLSNKELRVNVYELKAEKFYLKLGMEPYFKTLRFPMEDLHV